MTYKSFPLSSKKIIEAVTKLDDESLFILKNELQNSIKKLLESTEILNDEIKLIKTKVGGLKKEESHEDYKNDLILYLESVDENKKVIEDQKNRILMVDKEILARNLAYPESLENTTTIENNHYEVLEVELENSNQKIDEVNTKNHVYL